MIQDITALIANNETCKAIEALKTWLKEKGRSDLLKTLINQSAAFLQAQEFYANSLIDFKEFREAQSKVHFALMTVLEQLESPSPVKTTEKNPPTSSLHVENSKNVIAGTVNINTQGGDFIIGDRKD